MKTPLVTTLALSLLLSGCAAPGTSTITPNKVEVKHGSIDSTVPEQYDNSRSGFLFFTVNEKGKTTGAAISTGAKNRYNGLIRAYALKFKAAHKFEIAEGDGVKPFDDQYKNPVWWIDAEHYDYFGEMAGWSREEKDPDSVWMKIKDKLGQ